MDPADQKPSPAESFWASQDLLETLASEGQADRRMLRWSFAAAALFHLVLLLVTFPDLRAAQREFHRQRHVFVVQQTRFLPPPPPKGQPKPPPKLTKKIPIPDPTPDEPEPIMDLEIEIPEPEMPELDLEVFGIPEDWGPGPGLPFGRGDGPLQVGDGILAPVKIYAPQPAYTEDARLNRVQGVVILRTVVDREGIVAQVEILKGLPLGLTESAVETVKTWRFKPATRNGKPVSVYFAITVNFRLI